LIEEMEVEIETQNGDKKTYTISKFPAIAGREIICKYPTSAMPKVGDYEVNQETMLKLMKYVSCNGVALKTQALVDNHVPDWETLGKIEAEMIGYNCSFFHNGKISGFLDRISKISNQLTSSTLTDSLELLLLKIKQASKS